MSQEDFLEEEYEQFFRFKARRRVALKNRGISLSAEILDKDTRDIKLKFNVPYASKSKSGSGSGGELRKSRGTCIGFRKTCP